MGLRNALGNLALDSTVQGVTDKLVSGISTKPIFFKKLFFFDSSGRVEYIAYALPGTATSAEAWTIEKFVYGTYGVTQIIHADGSTNFDKVCDNYAGYDYF